MKVLLFKEAVMRGKRNFLKFYLILFALILLISGCNSDGSSGSNTASGTSFFASEKESFKLEKASDAIQTLLNNEQWKNTLSSSLPDLENHDTLVQLVQKFYQSKDYRPQWNSAEVGDATENLLQELEAVHNYGLDSSDFSIDELKKRVGNIYAEDEIDYNELAKAEITITAHYILLARQLGKGRIEGGKYLDDWYINPGEIDKVKNLEFALEEGVEQALSKLEPDYRQYDLLKEKLEGYIQIAENGGWESVEFKGVIEPGDSSKAIPSIRKRLQAETGRGGDLENPVYDQGLQEDIMDFRYRYDLSTDSYLIDQEVIAAMNEPAEERIRIINLNLDRCRWLTEPMGEKYILVNIPEYRMRVIENKKPVLDMKVIVGKDMNKTPVFSDSLEYVEFGPYWNVPVSITSEEILPKVLENPRYLESRHFEIVEGWGKNSTVIPPEKINWDTVTVENFPYRLRQKPGHWNSLGQVKFMFPNNKAIYLHDTPADHLFSKSEREFSHGCIRVEHPDQLADYLLPDKSRREVQNLMEANERKIFPLEEKIPVYLVYFTTIVDEEGRLRFLQDIYGMDKVQRQAL